MKPYESYKHTEEIWLDSIPDTWNMIKTKHLFSERSQKGFPDEPLLVASQNMGVVPKGVYGNRTVEASKDLHLLKLVKIGDFVISLRSFQGGIEYAHYQGIISPAYTIMILKDKSLSGYFRYLAKSKLFIELLKLCVTGIREGQNIDYEKLKNFYLPVPPLPEQDQIIRYLDWNLSKINKLIKARKKQITLLNEQKQAIINKAVTMGLDDSVTMKDSGVNWLGCIPKHWSIIKLRQILTPISEKNRPDLPLLSIVREKGVIIRDIEDKESNHNFIPDDLSGYKVVKKGQFAMNKMKAWQGSYGVSSYTGIVSPAYFIFNILFDNLDYFHYAIRSKVYVNFFAQASDGIRVGQWDLSIQKMKDIPFILPPPEEQAEIVNYIPKAFNKCDIAIAELSREIDLLTEYRTSLISSVVTGKVDVRDVVIPDFQTEDEHIDEEMSDEETEDIEEAEADF